MAYAGYNAMRDPKTNLPANWIVLGTACKVFDAMLAAAPKSFALVPLQMTPEMERVTKQPDWNWPDLLAAAEAATQEQFAVASSPAPLPQHDVLQEARESLSELLNLCAIGDVYALTQALGGGDALKRAQDAIVKLDVVLSEAPAGGCVQTARQRALSL